MLKPTLTILTILTATIAYGQTAEDLNKKSKELLGQQDYKSAVPVLKQAAEKGSAEAQYNFGVCYQQGVGVPKNDSIANAWFLKAAEKGWKDAQFKVAYSYQTGRGIRKDDKQSFYWSLKCAEQHDIECMRNVIFCYMEEIGVQKDEKQAFNWLLKCAELKDIQSMFDVVSCYMKGYGTQQNTDSMLVWATRLALLENPEDLMLSGQITSARANLAVMYRDGQDIAKDLQKSYMWFLIYNESKRDFSVLVQQKNITSIQALEKQLSQADRDKAKLEAEKL